MDREERRRWGLDRLIYKNIQMCRWTSQYEVIIAPMLISEHLHFTV